MSNEIVINKFNGYDVTTQEKVTVKQRYIYDSNTGTYAQQVSLAGESISVSSGVVIMTMQDAANNNFYFLRASADEPPVISYYTLQGATYIPANPANDKPVVTVYGEVEIKNDEANAVPVALDDETSPLRTTLFNGSNQEIDIGLILNGFTQISSAVDDTVQVPGYVSFLHCKNSALAETEIIESTNKAAHVTALGESSYFLSSASSLASIKNSSGKLTRIIGENTSNATVYIQFFDLAVGGITLGTTTPVLSIPVAGNGFFDYEINRKFTTAISYAVTTSPENNTTSSILLNAVYL